MLHLICVPGFQLALGLHDPLARNAGFLRHGYQIFYGGIYNARSVNTTTNCPPVSGSLGRALMTLDEPAHLLNLNGLSDCIIENLLHDPEHTHRSCMLSNTLLLNPYDSFQNRR